MQHKCTDTQTRTHVQLVVFKQRWRRHFRPGSWINTLPHSWQKRCTKPCSRAYSWMALICICANISRQRGSIKLWKRVLLSLGILSRKQGLFYSIFIYHPTVVPTTALLHPPCARTPHFMLPILLPLATSCLLSSCNWQRRRASNSTATASVWSGGSGKVSFSLTRRAWS